MAVLATVTDIMTSGYAEVMLWENGAPGKRRAIAESPKNVKARRGDVVELEPLDARSVKFANILYIIPAVFFILGLAVTRSPSWGERIFAGLIVGFMAFVATWIINRRSRMIRRQEYLITRVVEAHHV